MTREEAIKEIKSWDFLEGKEIEAIQTLVPELAESEDERIRKALIEVFKKKLERGFKWVEYGIPNRSVLDWLEKQKEQKHPNGCFTCDEYKKGYEEGRRNGFTAGYNKAMKEVEQKEQKPVEWSKEDEQRIAEIEFAVMQMNTKRVDTKDKCLAWLKSLRPHWKPSEEQMEALNALNCHGALSYVGQQNQLISLYNDLKKLI